MIKVQTILKVTDNSGAVFVSCIHLSRPVFRLGAGVGDLITVVVKKNFVKKNVKKSKKISKGQICTAVVVRTVKGCRR